MCHCFDGKSEVIPDVQEFHIKQNIFELCNFLKSGCHGLFSFHFMQNGPPQNLDPQMNNTIITQYAERFSTQCKFWMSKYYYLQHYCSRRPLSVLNLNVFGPVHRPLLIPLISITVLLVYGSVIYTLLFFSRSAFLPLITF